MKSYDIETCKCGGELRFSCDIAYGPILYIERRCDNCYFEDITEVEEDKIPHHILIELYKCFKKEFK